MKTSAIDVSDLLAVLNGDAMEKRIGGLPGVQSATLNFPTDEGQNESINIQSAMCHRGLDAAKAVGTALDVKHIERSRMVLA